MLSFLFTPLEHMLAYLSLSLSLSLCLFYQPLFASVGQASASIIASLTWSFFTSPLTHVLMHTVSSFGICQGMSWQHLNQPCVAG